ncbi:hypothetical protein GW17_00054586 [Ensete ventricosum]|nr:hypothetical protein GW17_00054586 [Ensete ventricosum]
MTRADVKVLQALEIMKSCHDFDSTINIKSLATIWKHYSIPNEYVLHAPGLGSRWLLLDCSGRFHYLIIPTHGRGFIEMVQEILAEEATRRALEDRIRGEFEVPSKRRAEDPVGQRKKGKGSSRHRFHHEADGSKSQMSKGNGPIDPVEETPAPRSKLKSVKELCSASPGVDGWDYHAI